MVTMFHNYDEDRSLLILSVLDEYLEEKGYSKEKLSETKVHKILYDIIEELDLDITRSWYLRGKYVWGARKAIKDFLSPNFRRKNISDRELSELGVSKEELKKTIENVIDKYSILFRTLLEYLAILYQEEAPEEFRDIYRANINLKENFSEFIDSLLSYIAEPRETLLGFFTSFSVDYISHSITKLHLAISKLDEIADVVIEYTSLLDEFVIGIEERFNSRSLKSDHVNFLKEAYEFYDENVWKLPATYIAIKTIKGSQAEEIRYWLEINQEKLSREVEDKLPKIEEEALKVDILPSEDYLKKRLEWDEATKQYYKLQTENIKR